MCIVWYYYNIIYFVYIYYNNNIGLIVLHHEYVYLSDDFYYYDIICNPNIIRFQVSLLHINYTNNTRILQMAHEPHSPSLTKALAQYLRFSVED